MLDTRIAQTTLENLLRDVILYALGNRLAQVASISALRALPTQAQAGSQFGDDHLITVAGAPILAFRWSQASTSADDGVSVIKPADVTANGRWLAWTSPVRFSAVVGAASSTLDQIVAGPLLRVIVLDKAMTTDEIVALLSGEVPSVVILADGDRPEDLTEMTGHRWDSEYDFTVTVVSEQFRDRREAAQGSPLAGESSIPGANSIDGFIKALLSGTALAAVVDGIRNTKLGECENWNSDFAQRRVMRSRKYTLKVTEEFPAAPGDSGPATMVTAQAHATSLDSKNDLFDPNNVVLSGMLATVAFGLTQPVAAGSALLGGATANYAGAGGVVFPALSDTYHDLLPNGTITFVSIPAGNLAPAVTATALRVAVTTTNAGAVISSGYVAAMQQNYGAQFQIPLS